jgi:hypothetical protein
MVRQPFVLQALTLNPSQREKPTGLDRYIFLNGLKGRDPAFFYHLLLANMPVC